MKKNILLAALLPLTICVSSLSIGLVATYNPNHSLDVKKIKKETLMKNQKWYLSSLNNFVDPISLNLKNDIISAFNENYPQYNYDEVKTTFFYGSVGPSDVKQEIQFVNEDFVPVFNLTVLFQSTTHKFDESYVTFDFRPSLPKVNNDYAFYFADTKISDFDSLQDKMNVYLKRSGVKADFKEQWSAMGLVTDKVNSYDQSEQIEVTDEFVLDAKAQFGALDFDTLDDLSFLKKLNTKDLASFVNADHPIKIQKGIFTEVKSSLWNNGKFDFGLTLASSYEDIVGKTFGDFWDRTRIFSKKALESIANSTVDMTKIVLKFSESYKDDSVQFSADTVISDLTNANGAPLQTCWMYFSTDKSANPFFDFQDNPGLHINLWGEN